MAGKKQHKDEGGGRKDKQSKNRQQDVKARRAGDDPARPRTARSGAPKAHKSGRQGDREQPLRTPGDPRRGRSSGR